VCPLSTQGDFVMLNAIGLIFVGVALIPIGIVINAFYADRFMGLVYRSVRS
jgi:hypothetical protein